MKLSSVIILILSVFLSVFIGGAATKPAAGAKKKDSVLVVIDAGHGGIDGGVTGVNTGVKESDINLEVAKALKEKLEAGGMTVVMTRTTPASLYGGTGRGFKEKDLKMRVEVAEKCNADLFISIHMNKYSDSGRRGAQVFYKIDDERSEKLAESVQKSFNDMKEASRECSALRGDYYVLNNNTVPSIICECGFLSNAEDEKLLLDEEYRNELAYAVFCGVVDYFSHISG